MKSMVALLSSAGSVLGIQQIVVKPPFAAALLPVAMVSFSSKPGCLKWQWKSTNPGQTTIPFASSVVQSAGMFLTSGAISFILPSVINKSPVIAKSCAGSKIRPFFISIDLFIAAASC
jgi:hypothetical protein